MVKIIAILFQSRRNNFYFNYLSKGKEHNSTDYQYEVTNDPKDWQYVEKLLPLEIVPVPKPKSHYPSGWRPCKGNAKLLLRYAFESNLFTIII